MAIDKESTGLPEFDTKRATTKVNLAIIVAAALFYALTFAVVFYLSRQSDDSGAPSPPIENVSR